MYVTFLNKVLITNLVYRASSADWSEYIRMRGAAQGLTNQWSGYDGCR